MSSVRWPVVAYALVIQMGLPVIVHLDSVRSAMPWLQTTLVASWLGICIVIGIVAMLFGGLRLRDLGFQPGFWRRFRQAIAFTAAFWGVLQLAV